MFAINITIFRNHATVPGKLLQNEKSSDALKLAAGRLVIKITKTIKIIQEKQLV